MFKLKTLNWHKCYTVNSQKISLRKVSTQVLFFLLSYQLNNQMFSLSKVSLISCVSVASNYKHENKCYPKHTPRGRASTDQGDEWDVKPGMKQSDPLPSPY